MISLGEIKNVNH